MFISSLLSFFKVFNFFFNVDFSSETPFELPNMNGLGLGTLDPFGFTGRGTLDPFGFTGRGTLDPFGFTGRGTLDPFGFTGVGRLDPFGFTGRGLGTFGPIGMAGPGPELLNTLDLG